MSNLNLYFYLKYSQNIRKKYTKWNQYQKCIPTIISPEQRAGSLTFRLKPLRL